MGHPAALYVPDQPDRTAMPLGGTARGAPDRRRAAAPLDLRTAQFGTQSTKGPLRVWRCRWPKGLWWPMPSGPDSIVISEFQSAQLSAAQMTPGLAAFHGMTVTAQRHLKTEVSSQVIRPFGMLGGTASPRPRPAPAPADPSALAIRVGLAAYARSGVPVALVELVG